jgi:hypothetical protein
MVPADDEACFLSIVLTGRNDEYGVDFQDRFLRTLSFNHRELVARGVSFEVVFVEWAPMPGRPLLIDIALDRVSQLRTGPPFRGLIVDPQYTKRSPSIHASNTWNSSRKRRHPPCGASMF